MMEIEKGTEESISTPSLQDYIKSLVADSLLCKSFSVIVLKFDENNPCNVDMEGTLCGMCIHLPQYIKAILDLIVGHANMYEVTEDRLEEIKSGILTFVNESLEKLEMKGEKK